MKTKHKIIIAACVAAVLGLLGLTWYWDSSAAKARNLAASSDIADRIQAIEMLRGKSGNLARETLLKLARDKEVRVGMAAVRAIGTERDEQTRTLLSEIAAGGGLGKVRGAAAAILGKFEATATEDLLALLKDEDAGVRAGAAEALSYKRDRGALNAILDAMADDEDFKVRRWAMLALHRTSKFRFSYYRLKDPQPRRRAAVARIRGHLRLIERTAAQEGVADN